MARSGPPSLGEFIRGQRERHELSMRQLAKMAGISHPYLSQIERGLRAPSEQVLEAIARSLELSAETLYEQAGLGQKGEDYDEPEVVRAIEADPNPLGPPKRDGARRGSTGLPEMCRLPSSLYGVTRGV